MLHMNVKVIDVLIYYIYKFSDIFIPYYICPKIRTSNLPIITKTSLFKYTENFSSKKNENFQKKIQIFFISAQNIDCGYSLEPPNRGGSNEYPQSMFLSRNKKNNVYPCKPQFYYIKVRFKGVRIT